MEAERGSGGGEDADAGVRDALAQARRQIEVGNLEARTTARRLREQLAEVRFDEFGAAPEQVCVRERK